MGQHKHNPTAILAKEGKLPPKETKISKREQERLLKSKIREKLYIDKIYDATGIKEEY